LSNARRPSRSMGLLCYTSGVISWFETGSGPGHFARLRRLRSRSTGNLIQLIHAAAAAAHTARGLFRAHYRGKGF
jgi:hypothetical protein